MLQPPLLFTDLRALLLVLSLNHLNCLVFNVAAFFIVLLSSVPTMPGLMPLWCL
jgi:hypothetical protein